jgi:hypothetical protein
MYERFVERAARWLARVYAVATTERPLQKCPIQSTSTFSAGRLRTTK